MKLSLQASICICFCALFATPLVADTPNPLPATVVLAMQQREQQLNHLTTIWNIKFDMGKSPQVEPTVSKQAQMKNAIRQLKESGFAGTERQLQKAAASIAQVDLFKPRAIHTTTRWTITRNGTDTMIEGGYLSTFNCAPSIYAELFSGSNAIAVDELNNNTKKGLVDPAVWSTTNSSITTDSPALFQLHVQPAEFSLLAGTNPLQTYTANWTVLSETPTDWVLQGKTSPKNTDPLTLMLTVDRKYMQVDAMSEKSDDEPWKYDWQVSDFKVYNGCRIGTHIELHTHAAGVGDVNETYILQSIEPAQPISIHVPERVQVHDYRLLGSDLTSYDVRQAEMQNKPDIVYYQWGGSIPSVKELQRLHQDQHPGEATPDPKGKTSMLPTVGGLACLIGGILTFRRRGNGVG